MTDDATPREEIKRRVRAEIKAEMAAKFGAEKQRLKHELKYLSRELQKVESYRYGSYTPGRDDWARRWDESKGRRILLFAPVDASGSFYKWTDAINRHTPYAARLVTLHRHKHNYELDLLLPFPDLDSRSELARICEEADIFHLKDEPGFFLRQNQLDPETFQRFSKPQVFTAHGGYMRKLEPDPDFRAFVQAYDAHVAMTPDLNYDWFNGVYIPHAIDTETFSYGWDDTRILGHSPTRSEDPEKKGTQFFTQAVEQLDEQHPDFWDGWTVDLITGVSYEECMARKRLASLFFDQAGMHTESAFGIEKVIGWYGNSAIEAMAFGIPTIAHLSQEALEGARRAGVDIERRCSVLNIDRSTASMKDTISDFAASSPAARNEMARKTRQWAHEFHGYEAVAHSLADLYSGLLGQRVS